MGRSNRGIFEEKIFARTTSEKSHDMIKKCNLRRITYYERIINRERRAAAILKISADTIDQFSLAIRILSLKFHSTLDL